MSTGNDNFITLDSIAEIQDIVNGDYMFTISNGVIYKLDFQNFIISRENTDFFTTIDTLSAQVVTNTQSLCSINAYINDTVKPGVSKIDSIYSTLNALSANWNTTYTTINTLSSQAFLPISDQNNNIDSGSLLYYDGIGSKFITLPPGGITQILSVGNNGLPAFMDNDVLITTVLTSGLENIINKEGYGKSSARFYDEEINYTIYNESALIYKNVRISVNLNVSDTVSSSGDKGTIDINQLEIEYGNGIIAPVTNGIAVIDELPANTSIVAKVKVKGEAPPNGSRKIDLNYSITGQLDSTNN